MRIFKNPLLHKHNENTDKALFKAYFFRTLEFNWIIEAIQGGFLKNGWILVFIFIPHPLSTVILKSNHLQTWWKSPAWQLLERENRVETELL